MPVYQFEMDAIKIDLDALLSIFIEGHRDKAMETRNVLLNRQTRPTLQLHDAEGVLSSASFFSLNTCAM